jgi:hypothetical protein
MYSQDKAVLMCEGDLFFYIMSMPGKLPGSAPCSGCGLCMCEVQDLVLIASIVHMLV